MLVKITNFFRFFSCRNIARTLLGVKAIQFVKSHFKCQYHFDVQNTNSLSSQFYYDKKRQTLTDMIFHDMFSLRRAYSRAISDILNHKPNSMICDVYSSDLIPNLLKNVALFSHVFKVKGIVSPINTNDEITLNLQKTL